MARCRLSGAPDAVGDPVPVHVDFPQEAVIDEHHVHPRAAALGGRQRGRGLGGPGQVDHRRPGLEENGTGMVITGNSAAVPGRSEEHTSELQSLMRSSYAVFCLKKKKITT